MTEYIDDLIDLLVAHVQRTPVWPPARGGDVDVRQVLSLGRPLPATRVDRGIRIANVITSRGPR